GPPRGAAARRGLHRAARQPQARQGDPGLPRRGRDPRGPAAPHPRPRGAGHRRADGGGDRAERARRGGRRAERTPRHPPPRARGGMIARRVSRGELSAESVAGRVLCNDLRGTDGRIALRKGAVLGASDLPALEAARWEELHLLEMEPGEVHEDDAGRAIAAAAAGDGVEPRPPAAGAWPIAATRRGILHVEVEPLRRINRVEGLALYSLYSGQVVGEGEV